MSDLIRREDAREALRKVDAWTMPIAHAINSLPSVTVGEDVAKAAIDRAIERLRALPNHAGRPAWDAIVAEEINAALEPVTAPFDAAEFAAMQNKKSDAELMLDALTEASARELTDRVTAAAIREAKPRIIPMHSQSMYGVCIGGRWDGWVMVKHPDGYWVSHNKPDPVDPSIPDFAAKGTADDRA